jgi:hypothetical protein
MSDGQMPSEFPEVSQRPVLRDFLGHHIDMQFEDIRGVLRLPQLAALGTTGGGNFLATTALIAAICGASTLFYKAGPQAFEYPYQSRKRFLGTMGYMPWDSTTAGVKHRIGSERLWEYARNPLAHAFGVSYNPGKVTGKVPNSLRWSLAIAKRSYELQEIYILETSSDRPDFVNVPLQRVGTQPEEFILDVGGLYWGVHRMLHALLADSKQADAAEQMVHRLIAGSSQP